MGGSSVISKCIVFEAPFEVAFAEIDVPAPGPGRVVTRTLFTGVSTGTETRVLRGAEVDQFPLIPGYENVGEVVEVGPGVSLVPGQLVFHGGSDFTGRYARCWGAQAGVALIEAANAIPLPAGLDPVKALYAMVGGIALHGVNRARVTTADTVAVVGLGLIGSLAAQAARARGARVIAIDREQDRLATAKAAGFEVLDAGGDGLEAQVRALCGGGVDVAIDATGVASAVEQTARLVRSMPWNPPYPASSRVVLLGSYTEPVAFSYHPTLFDNEPDILPSRYTTRQEMEEMLQLLASGGVDPSLLPARVLPFGEAPGAYRDLLDRKQMRVVFDWREER
jgi:2-desacetyl-2-hydroxyethyl bacteriochlorophyllide A dehydrogenase